jgi:fumarate hydratase subunit alpha
MAIKEIQTDQIVRAVAGLCLEANTHLGADVIAALLKALHEEESPLGKEILGSILENAGIDSTEKIPLCQDCGVAVLFVEIGQDVHISGGDVSKAILEGIRLGYQQGYLRKSMVAKPFSQRINTLDNSPAIIHYDIVAGNQLKITLMPKGGGAENVSRLAMLKPGDGIEGITSLVVETVRQAGADLPAADHWIGYWCYAGKSGIAGQESPAAAGWAT